MEEQAEYKKLIEAALFISAKALSASEIAQVVGIASVGSVNKMITELMVEYDQKGGSLGIFKIGDKYILSVKEPYAGRLSSLAGQPDISKGALRLLAFVSKNEPVMQSSVVKTFGSTSYDYLHELQEKEFIIAAKTGRTKRLETTNKFKEYFNF